MTNEQIAKIFGCTTNAVRRQFAANAAQTARMADKARTTGRKVNGYTLAQLETITARQSKAAQ